MSLMNGFAGMRLVDGKLSFRPQLPARWRKLTFRITFVGRFITVQMQPNGTIFELEGRQLTVTVDDSKVTLKPGKATACSTA